MSDSSNDNTSELKGLTAEAAARLLQKYGPNSLEEERVSPLLKLLGYF